MLNCIYLFDKTKTRNSHWFVLITSFVSVCPVIKIITFWVAEIKIRIHHLPLTAPFLSICYLHTLRMESTKELFNSILIFLFQSSSPWSHCRRFQSGNCNWVVISVVLSPTATYRCLVHMNLWVCLEYRVDSAEY